MVSEEDEEEEEEEKYIKRIWLTTISLVDLDIDLFKAPQSLINTLKGQGKYVICYFR